MKIITLNESLEQRQAHLDLSQPCLERGGDSLQHRGVLAQFLDSTIPDGKIFLCHACHNGKCSNPRHIYWGSPRENVHDAIANGATSIWDRIVAKYGLEEAKRMNSKGRDFAKGGRGNAGKPKSEEHKRKISEALKKRV